MASTVSISVLDGASANLNLAGYQLAQTSRSYQEKLRQLEQRLQGMTLWAEQHSSVASSMRYGQSTTGLTYAAAMHRKHVNNHGLEHGRAVLNGAHKVSGLCDTLRKQIGLMSSNMIRVAHPQSMYQDLLNTAFKIIDEARVVTDAESSFRDGAEMCVRSEKNLCATVAGAVYPNTPSPCDVTPTATAYDDMQLQENLDGIESARAGVQEIVA